MAETLFANMQIVPEKFSDYVIERTTEKSTLVSAGIATPDAAVKKLITGTPEGGNFIQLPMYKPLEGEEDIFSEEDLTVGDVKTGQARATILLRGKAWGASDLARVKGGSDPMAAIISLISDWRTIREQKVYLSILKGLFAADGAMKEHLNDISAGTGEAAYISREATLDTKQLLGDHYGSLGMVFVHSATYTYLQKKELILRQPWINPVGETVEIETFMGYRVIVDDGMPVAEGVYDTYFMGKGAFIREEGTPEGFIPTETDRDKLGGKSYLINRWAQVIHPRGLSFTAEEFLNEAHPYAANADLELATNWRLVADHKRVALACLKHKLG